MDTLEKQKELNIPVQSTTSVEQPQQIKQQQFRDNREERTTQTDTTASETGTTSTQYDNLDPNELWGLRNNLVQGYLQEQGGVPTMEDVLGVDPQRMERYREGQKKLNEFKRKEALWYNGLSVLGDILTAGHGGNVWQRNPNQEAEKSRIRNEQIEQEAMNDKARAVASRRDVLGRAGKAADDFIARLIGNYKPSSMQTTGKSRNQSETGATTTKSTGNTTTEETGTGGYVRSGRYANGSGMSTFYVRPNKNRNSSLSLVKTDFGERRKYDVPNEAIPDIIATVKVRPDIMALYKLTTGRTEKRDDDGRIESYSVKYAPDEEFVNAYLNEVEAGRLDPPEWMMANPTERPNTYIENVNEQVNPVSGDFNQGGFY